MFPTRYGGETCKSLSWASRLTEHKCQGPHNIKKDAQGFEVHRLFRIEDKVYIPDGALCYAITYWEYVGKTNFAFFEPTLAVKKSYPEQMKAW